MSLLEFDSNLGLILPSTQEIRDDIGAKIQAAFQTKPTDPVLNIEPSSPMGQVLDLLVAEIEAKNAEIVFLANMADPNTAQGRFLDALAALYGIRRKISEPTIVTVTVTGLRGTVVPYGAIAQDANGNQYRHNVVQGVTIPQSGSITTTFASIEHGAVEVAAESLNRIVTVVAGWDSIFNPAAGALGRDRETDAELRGRMAESYAINATGYVDAIRANLANLEGVIDVEVLENSTNLPVTKYGITIDPHSIAISIVGGEDTDVAEIIYRRKDAGCGTTGATVVEYFDEDYNASYHYNITRPINGALKVKVETFATYLTDDTISDIKTALVNDINGLGDNPRIGIAQTVYASRFYQVVQGVTNTPLRLISIALDDGAYSQSIEIPATIEPTIDRDDITITLEG